MVSPAFHQHIPYHLLHLRHRRSPLPIRRPNLRIAVTSGREIGVHRCILSACSSFIRIMFASNSRENDKESGNGRGGGVRVLLKDLAKDFDVDYEALMAVLGYLCSGKFRPLSKGINSHYLFIYREGRGLGRLTESADFYSSTEQGKISPKDRLCIEILEQAIFLCLENGDMLGKCGINKLTTTVKFSIPHPKIGFKALWWIPHLICCACNATFSMEAKLAMDIAQVDAWYI